MGHFGFSYIGVLYLLMLFIPNILWAKFPPQGYSAAHEHRVLGLFEKAGQVLVTACALIFSDFNLHGADVGTIWLVLSFLCMLLYEGYWIRYFRSARTLEDMYASFYHIPYAGATLPIMAFALLGIYGKVIWMIISVIILGIGHIGIHIQHAHELK